MACYRTHRMKHVFSSAGIQTTEIMPERGRPTERSTMKVLIAGGNGYIGRHLSEALVRRGDRVVWLSRTPGRFSEDGLRHEEYHFDPVGSPADLSWREALTGADAVVNLSGAPIASRWNAAVKQALIDSRVETGRALVDAIAALPADERPEVYVTGSGIGIYGERGDALLDEHSTPGEDWLAQLAVAWEREARRAAEHGVRHVLVRTSVVLGDEGFLPKMLLPMKLFAGGPVGSGRQWFPWIHIDDIAGAYAFVIHEHGVVGAVNATAPESLRMSEFAAALGRALHRPSWFPVPLVVLRIVLGEVAPYTLFSQRAVPSALQSAGYEFRFPTIDEALGDLTA